MMDYKLIQLKFGRFEVRFAGSGGQGLIKSSLILAQAASKQGKNVIQLQSYGAEVRGGASRSDVIISDNVIDYPGVLALDVLVALTQEAYDKYLPLLKPNGIVIFDSDLVRPALVENIEQHGVPFTRIAKKIGSKVYANSVVLGYFAAVTNIVSKDVLRETLARNVPPRTVEANLKAFDEGYKIGCTR